VLNNPVSFTDPLGLFRDRNGGNGDDDDDDDDDGGGGSVGDDDGSGGTEVCSTINGETTCTITITVTDDPDQVPGQDDEANSNAEAQDPSQQLQQNQTPCSSAGNAPSPQQYQAMGYVARASWLFGPGVGGLSNAGALAMFKRGLPLDAQVIYGGSQAYANYVYGVFMSAAGYPQSSYPQNTPMSPNYPSTPASNVTNITKGYNAQKSGTLCSTTK